jgi:hypothetical protein
MILADSLHNQKITLPILMKIHNPSLIPLVEAKAEVEKLFAEATMSRPRGLGVMRVWMASGNGSPF